MDAAESNLCDLESSPGIPRYVHEGADIGGIPDPHTVWTVKGDHAAEIPSIVSRVHAFSSAATMNAAAPAGVRYVALPLGGSPFDE